MVDRKLNSQLNVNTALLRNLFHYIIETESQLQKKLDTNEKNIAEKEIKRKLTQILQQC